jgi:hypothetical protein
VVSGLDDAELGVAVTLDVQAEATTANAVNAAAHAAAMVRRTA